MALKPNIKHMPEREKTDLHNEWTAADLEKIAAIEQTRQRNFAILDTYSRYLNEAPCFVTPDLMEEMTQHYGLTTNEAYLLLFANACGADPQEGKVARTYIDDYIRPSLSQLSPIQYAGNPYSQHIHIPNCKFGRWRLGQEHYAPYEAFIWKDLTVTADYREIPNIGYFCEEFHFPAVFEDGREWMSVKPNEVETIQPAVDKASGKVVAFGLGLGYFAYMASEKEVVDSVTIVERDPDVIQLFRQIILPQFSHPEKVMVVQADAFDYAERLMPQQHFSFAFVDLWHDAADGVPLYRKMKRLEHGSPSTCFEYWVEDTLLSHLRWTHFSLITDALRHHSDTLLGIHSYEEVKRQLGNKYLREWAKLDF